MSWNDCKTDGLCRSAAICFLDGCQAEKARVPPPSAQPDPLLALIDLYASKRALHSFLEATRVAVERKTRGPRPAEQAAANDAANFRDQIVAALANRRAAQGAGDL